MPLLTQIQHFIEVKQISGAGENFQCDGFGFELQTELSKAGIDFSGQVMVLRRTPSDMPTKAAERLNLAMGGSGTIFPKKASDRQYGITIGPSDRFLAKIILREEGHNLDGQVVGNDSHFWTEIEMDNGEVYCFDNNHPQGVIKEDFYHALDFTIEKFLNGIDESRDASKLTAYEDPEHDFQSGVGLIDRGHVAIAEMTVKDQRFNATYNTKWKSSPSTDLPNSHVMTLDELRPRARLETKVQSSQDNFSNRQAQRQEALDLHSSSNDPDGTPAPVDEHSSGISNR